MWQSRYHQPNRQSWEVRKDIPPRVTIGQCIDCLHLSSDTLPIANELAFALLGFASDEGIKRNMGRVGAALGPTHIRQALAKLPLSRAITLIDVGDITCADAQLEEAQTALAQVVATLLQANYIPILLGGGHEMAWGHYQGIAKANRATSLAIINFDAHFDMRSYQKQGTSGTPFLQMAQYAKAQHLPFTYHCLGIQSGSNINPLYDTAKTHDVRFLTAEAISLQPELSNEFINQCLTTHSRFYISLCLDVFASAYAPGVSAPQPLGLTPWQLIPLLRQFTRTGSAISYDIAELSPKHDVGEMTAKLAAFLIHDILHFHGKK